MPLPALVDGSPASCSLAPGCTRSASARSVPTHHSGQISGPLGQRARRRPATHRLRARRSVASALWSEDPLSLPPRQRSSRRAASISTDAVDHARRHRLQELEPTKYSPGSGPTTPRRCLGSWSPRTGGSIHESPGWNPVHRMTLLASSTRPSCRLAHCRAGRGRSRGRSLTAATTEAQIGPGCPTQR